MTPEQQNIAIAEHLGDWKDCRVINGQHGDCDRIVGIPAIIDGTWGEEEEDVFPRYHSDLNACAEFEATLSQSNVAKYNHALQSICLDAPMSDTASDYGWHATAPQRCEAFLRAIGKWRHEP